MPDVPNSSSQAPEAVSSEAHHDLALRMLYDEQARLRAELERLHQEKETAGKGADGKKDGGEQDKDGEGDKKEGEDKKDGGKDGKDKDGEEGKDDKDKKPPLKARAGGWIREHPLGTVGILVGLVALVAVSIWLFLYLGSYETTDDAFVQGHTDPISPRINGFVTGVYVENTYRVKKGQLLVQLDPRDYQVSKEQAAAQVGQAQANVAAQAPNIPITSTTQGTQVTDAVQNVASSEANVSAARAREQAAEADLEQAQAQEANAAREEERYRLLVTKEEVSRELYDQRATDERTQAALVASRRDTAAAAAKQVLQAEASLRQAQDQLKQAKTNLPQQIAAQRATLAERQASANAAKAQADMAELNLEYTRIYAPEDGIIGDKTVELNTQVAPGQEMFALTQTNDLWVEANFKETEIQKMRPGQSVRIHVDALSLDFDGYVEALPGGTGAVYSLLPPENATGNYVKVVQRLPVRIRFKPNQPGEERLAPGMSVEPKVWVK